MVIATGVAVGYTLRVGYDSKLTAVATGVAVGYTLRVGYDSKVVATELCWTKNKKARR